VYVILSLICRSTLTRHLSVTACGDRFNETVIMLKSAALFSRQPFHVHIFADDELRPQFRQQVRCHFLFVFIFWKTVEINFFNVIAVALVF